MSDHPAARRHDDPARPETGPAPAPHGGAAAAAQPHHGGAPAGAAHDGPAQVVLPQAVLWDLDGTLVDTEPYWFEAERRVVEAHGGAHAPDGTAFTWGPEHHARLIGSDLLDGAEGIRRMAGIDLDPATIVAELVSHVATRVAQEVQWRPGVRELLADLAHHGVPCAMVTMSYRVIAEAVASVLPADRFRVLVTGDEVPRGKPHPDPYLLAAAKLGVDPARCIAVEDSVTGTASAEAAGVPLVAVRHMQHLDERPSRVVLDSLEGVDAHGLARLVAGVVPAPSPHV